MARPFDNLSPEILVSGPAHGPDALLLPGLGEDPAPGLAEVLAGLGLRVHRLAWPGAGQEAWQVPPQAGLADYALYAARAARGLRPPLLAGVGLGGLLALKLLEVAPLPALLIAPLAPGLPRAWAAMPGLARRARLEISLGLWRPRPSPAGSARLVMSLARGQIASPGRLARLAHGLGAGFVARREFDPALVKQFVELALEARGISSKGNPARPGPGESPGPGR